VHLGPFGWLAKLGAKWADRCKSSCYQVALEFYATNAPNPPNWSLNSCFRSFCSIWAHLGLFGCITRCKTGRTGTKVCATKSRQNFSQQTQLICPHWTLNSCFCAFCTIWVHLGPFGCVTTLSLKPVKLVQKFVTRSRVRIFYNERTRSTPLDPKLMFWRVSYYFDAFGTVWLARKTQWKTGRTNAKVRATKSRQNVSQRTHPIHPIGP